MTGGREWKHILLFTLPIIAGSLLQQMYNIVDGIVVGNFIGDDAFAGVGTCGALGFIFMSVAVGLGTGIGVVISQYFGARRYKELGAAIDTSIIITGAFGLFFSVFGVVVTPFLLRVIFNTPETILPYAVLYFRIFCIGFVFQFIYNGISFVLRGMGDSKASLYFLIVSTVLNGILAVIFVTVFHWGVAGTAIASVISQLVCVVISYVYLKKRCVFENTGKHFDRTACKHILRYGIPSAVQQLIISIGGGAIQRLLNGFGKDSIAAFTAASRINMLMFSPFFGFQAGLATFTGQNIGAGRLDRVKRGLRSTMLISMGLAGLVCVTLYILAPPFIRLFALDGEALLRGIEMLRFYSYFFLTFCFQMVISGVLQGAGDIAVQSIATVSALVIRVAGAYLGVRFGVLGYNAIWVSDVISWSALIIIVTIRYVSGKWKTKAVVTQSDDPEPAASLCTDSENEI
jgi:putative MATE family efflux protein